MEPKEAPTRIIAHFDCDCFEVQIFQLEAAETRGKPCIVANTDRGITSVSYEARNFGITRKSRVSEAQEKCPALIVFNNAAGTSDRPKDSKLREIGKRLQTLVRAYIESKDFLPGAIFEFAGNDEFWLDLTTATVSPLEAIPEPDPETSFFYESEAGRISLESLNPESLDNLNIRLFRAAGIASQLTQILFQSTGIVISAGIGTNKFVSKLGGGLNKPAAITIVPPAGLSCMSKRIRLDTVPGLKGTLGTKVSRLLKVETLYELGQVDGESLISNEFGVTEIRKIRGLSQGECSEAVRARLLPSRLKFSRTFSETRQNELTEATFPAHLQRLCHGFEERIHDEERLYRRRPGRGSVSIKRTERSLCVPIEILDEFGGDQLYGQIMSGLELEDKFQPWANVLKIGFQGKDFVTC